MSFISLKENLPPIAPDTSWPSLLELSAREVFTMMVGVDVRFIPPSPAPLTEIMSAIVGMAGRLSAIFRVFCEQPVAISIGKRMLGDQSPGDLLNARDALGEISNMVAGNFKAKIDGLADGCMLSVPTVIVGRDFQVHMVPQGERLELCVEYEAHPVGMILEIRR